MKKKKYLVKGSIALDTLGLREFNKNELQGWCDQLRGAIQLGLARIGPPTEANGGLLAIPTGVETITPQQWQQVEPGTTVVSCAYAGTNWQTALVKKDLTGNAVIIPESTQIIIIPKEARQKKFQQLIEMMAEQIYLCLKGYKNLNISTIAVSFGFAQINQRVGWGIDARLITATPSKYWEITDFYDIMRAGEQPFIGRVLMDSINNQGFNIQRIFFQNDTNAVSNNIAIFPDETNRLPVGAVFGTGSNIAFRDRNLEIGRAKVVPPDSILMRMIEHGLVPIKENLIEYWTGGDYIKNRVAVALLILGKQGKVANGESLFNTIISSDDGSLISRLASGQLRIGTPETYRIVQECCRLALFQAGQLIGAMLTAVINAAGYKGGRSYFPIEGSVFYQGYGVEKAVIETLKILIPGNQIVFRKASGLIGVAQLAMVENNTKYK